VTHQSLRHALAALAVLVSAAGCGASARMQSAPMAASTAAVPAAPLERSLFARDPNGQLSEEHLQTILAAPIELDLPARVGVLPIITAEDWRGPNPDYQQVPAGTAALVKTLRGTEPFTLVTDVMPIPSGALGMEALREIAARYRLRYVILYREVMLDDRQLNGWAWGYVTLVGALFLPGEDLEVRGFLEASMFDVKTGTLMVTTRRAISASRRSNEFHNDHKVAVMRRDLAVKFAPELARDLRGDIERFARAAAVESERRAPVTVSAPPAGGAS
jgi:hypothetical protein